MLRRLQPVFLLIVLFSACKELSSSKHLVQSEFDPQEYIWMSWVEDGFLGGDPFFHTILDAMAVIEPHVKIRLRYARQNSYNEQQVRQRIIEQLLARSIDTSRVELVRGEPTYASIQDPGPIFLKNANGDIAIADFNFSHPDTVTESIDRRIAHQYHLPTIKSVMITEGGAWQTNGKGSLLLVEAVELDRNPSMTKTQIEDEYKRVLGVTNVVWLKQGPKEEEWGQLENGIFAIGTAGHIDEFCRFADPTTILLAEVYPHDTVGNKISAETYRRMEENRRILETAVDQDGHAFKILRAPTALLMSKKIATKGLNRAEMFYLQNTEADSAEFYLTTGYFNFVIANDVVVTSKYWTPGMDEKFRIRDEEAKIALQKAFPKREIVQIDCMPVHHDGAGLHCHSRSQPK